MVCIVQSGTLLGVDGVAVLVEVDLLRRLPCVVIVGLPSGAVREASERVRSAIGAAGCEFPKSRVVVNLAPADLPKGGTAFDLPIALGVLASDGQVDREALETTLFVGELSLEGNLRSVRGALSLALDARHRGLKRIVLPACNAAEAAWVEGIEVLGMKSLEQVVGWLRGEVRIEPAVADRAASIGTPNIDLADVRGQARARRALEVAAAGGHNLLMLGPPGCGKTMLATRLPTIFPAVTHAEAVDVTRIHSVAGLIPSGGGLIDRRPFRAPHHSVSVAGMIGNAALQPGEVSLAHHGVLFLDELPEFSRRVLEMLRGPLEDRCIHLTRSKGRVVFPASISLVAAANPCPCGFLGHPTRPCTCLPSAVDRYRARLSGPLLDRIDLHLWVQPVSPEALVTGKAGESSKAVRLRVERARARQRARLEGTSWTCNAQLAGKHIRTAAGLNREAEHMLQRLMDEHQLSARAWARILRVARTIADLEGSPGVGTPHVLEAVSYRVPVAELAA